MPELTLNLPDHSFATIRARAQRSGKKLEEYAAELLDQLAREGAPAPNVAPADAPLDLSPQVRRLLGSLKLPLDFDYKRELGEALDERHGL